MAFRSGESDEQGDGWRRDAFGSAPRDQLIERLGYAVKRPFFALPFYPMSLATPGATRLAVVCSDTWPGNAEGGAAIVEGRFELAGESRVEPHPLWAPPGASRAWREELNGFGWLRDLRAVGGDAARRRARDLVQAWLDANAVAWDSLIWNPAVTGRRLAHWLGHYEFFAASASVDLRHRLLYEIARQGRHLSRVLPAGLTGTTAVAAIKGLITVGTCLPERDAWRQQGLDLLRRELGQQVLADGGQVERSPARQFELLRDLIDLRALLSAGELPVPGYLQAAIAQMAPVLKLLQHGDGGLALFNDSSEGAPLAIDMVLQRADLRGRPMMSAPQSGFQRLQAGRTLVLVDCGRPPAANLDRSAHAGTLSLEVSIGRERLIVNCGAHPGDPVWRQAQRATAAHSTLVLDDINSSEIGRDGAIKRRPSTVVCRREEAEANVWLDTSHDGYKPRFGRQHHRRLYLSAAGDDLRGEDSLTGRGGRRFAIRFHLHPEVQATVSQGGESVLLRLPRGGGWRLRGQGAELALEESVYLGSPGQVRKTQQVVLSGTLTEGTTAVKWALRHETKTRGTE